MCFEAMSGLKINFDKSEAMVVGCELEEQLRAAHMMNCKLEDLLIKYLGMIISNKALRIQDFESVVKKVADGVEPWHGWLMASVGGSWSTTV